MDTYRREVYRELVISFENEYKEKVSSLNDLEKDILLVSGRRREWFKNIVSLDHEQAELYRKKVEIYKTRAELASVLLNLDIIRLDGHYETQTLNYLIEVTKPPHIDDSNEEISRNLSEINFKNAIILQDALSFSVDYRAKIASNILEYQLELESLKVEYTSNYYNAIQVIKNRLDAFAYQIKQKANNSESNNKELTGEYLVLRHNARVAQEILTKSKNEAITTREQLQIKFDKFLIDTSKERERIELASKEELKMLTDDMRNKVLRKENEAEHRKNYAKEQSNVFGHEFLGLKNELRHYNHLYEELQMKRGYELTNMNSEVKRLREMISEMEIQIRKREHDSLN